MTKRISSINIVVGYNNNIITRPLIPPCSSYWKFIILENSYKPV